MYIIFILFDFNSQARDRTKSATMYFFFVLTVCARDVHSRCSIFGVNKVLKHSDTMTDGVEGWNEFKA